MSAGQQKRQRPRRRNKRPPLTVIVWLGAIVVAGGLFGLRGEQTAFKGVARTVLFEVSPNASGTVARVTVDLYDRVEAGEIVAMLNAEQVAAKLATAEARLGELRADLDSAQDTLVRGIGPNQLDWRSDLRRFEIDTEKRRLDALELEVRIETDQVERQRLATQLNRLRALHEGGYIATEELDNAELLHERVSTRIRKNEKLRIDLQETLVVAEERLTKFEDNLARDEDQTSLLGPWKAAIDVQKHKIEEVRTARAGLVLRAPVSGQVTQVRLRPGSGVTSGETVVTISQDTVTEVIAYLPESEPFSAERDSRVLLSRSHTPWDTTETEILRASPHIERLPKRLWNNPVLPEYGRPFIVASVPSLGLLPGEQVSIRFLP